MTVGKFKVNKPPTPPEGYNRKTPTTAVKKKKTSVKKKK